MATITIDYTPAVHQGAGIGRLTREVVGAALAIGAPQYAFRLFCMGAPANWAAGLPVREHRGTAVSDRWFHRIWYRANLPLSIDWFAGRSDLYHATDFILPPTAAPHTILTVHDLTFERDPNSAAPTLLAFLKRAVPDSVRRAGHIIADSQATADDLHTLYGVPRERMTVILSGVEVRFRPEPQSSNEEQLLRAKYKIGDAPFVLAVGTLQRRKNHLGLVRAFAKLRDRSVNLVIAGGKGWLYDDVLAEIRAARLTDRVVFTGFVDDDDLPALYRSARVLAFPSFYEGFGLPPLEAMASGTPVVASNASSLPEVVGDAALSVDPHDELALAAALDRALSDGAWRRDAIGRGLARAAGFTWQRAAEQLLSVYQRYV
jgi:glycosyltransferase involved in cell wall biosynthesis